MQNFNFENRAYGYDRGYGYGYDDDFNTGRIRRVPKRRVIQQPNKEVAHMLTLAKAMVFFANDSISIYNLVFPMAKTKDGVEFRQFVADPKVHNLGFLSDEPLFKKKVDDFDLDNRPITGIGYIFSDCKIVINEDKTFYRLLNNGKKVAIPLHELQLFSRDVSEMYCKFNLWNLMTRKKQFAEKMAKSKKELADFYKELKEEGFEL